MDSTNKPYKLVIDDDVKLAAEFIAKSIPFEKRVFVAQGLTTLAPILWRKLSDEEFRVLRIRPESPMVISNAAQIPIAST